MLRNLKLFDNYRPTLSVVNWIGHLFFIVYFAFSYYYYLERSLAFDSAWYAFKIVLFNKFNIENGRWGVFYTQLLPLLAFKAGFPLKTFLLLYSLSYAVWNYIFFLVIVRFFKNATIGLGYILALVIFYRYSFFYPVSEIHSTIGPLFIFAACLYKLYEAITEDRSRIRNYTILSILLIFWVVNIHVLSMLMIFFFFVYLFIDKRASIRTYWILYTIFIGSGLLLFIKLALIKEGSYESSKLINLESIKLAFNDLEAVAGYWFFKKDIVTNYSLTLLFTFATLIVLIRKDLLKAAFIVVALTGFFLIIMAYNIKPDCPLNYQNYNCFLGVILSLTLVEDLLSKFSKPFIILLVSVLFLFSFYKIVKSGVKFTDRTAYLKRTIENFRQFDEKKFIICEWNIPPVTVWTDWDFCYESLLLSSINSPDSSITFFPKVNLWEYDHYVNKDPKCFVGITYLPTWWQLNTDTIGTRYFKFKDGFYRKANSLQDSLFADTVFTKENMNIVLKDKYSLLRSEVRQIELEIQNNSDINFSTYVTSYKTLWLSYHIYNKEGDLIIPEGNRTNIEMDIPPHSSIRNGLTIDLEKFARGEYIIEVDIVHENKRWFRINKRARLIIY